MSLHVDVLDSMQSDRLHIRAVNLAPNGIYKLILSHKYGTHMSYAIFKADSAGEIDVPTMKPVRGSYNGVLLPSSACFRTNASQHFSLIDSADRELTMVPIKKHWMHPNLERIEIEEDGFCGTLFKPPGDGPFPAVIDISGTGGGLHEHKGSMLASEGFVVLCVAFFQYKNLVKDLNDVDLEYFEKPIKWLKRQPYTTDRLGIQGVSFGATIVVLIASRYPEVNAVVAINGPHVQSNYANVKENGELLPEAELADNLIYFINGVMASDKTMLHAKFDSSIEIPWHRMPPSTSFRIASVDDLVAPSVFSGRYMAKNLKANGCDVEIHLLNGGHIMEPPYFPHHDIVFAKFQGFCCGYGGDAVLHGKSQEISWQGTIDFFKRKLGQPATMPDWNRLRHVEHASRL
ncbi:unnamed protein product [Heligmosomoides polygyrus]|uniref:BAAT/acyl-CoA thioester hydrolase protein n=1 Tax=Heligmosomoides polygyrus TaxID=6339 RepID=A0A183FFZ2_HELPZ|nr:unnamed protein product [Heligmosomoides polygyrus]